ncbi:MAG: InlB B-repeat-containing protein [Bacilli bacterium]
MKKIRNVIFLMAFLFIALFSYSCTTIDNIDPTKPEYTVTFVDQSGEILTQVTNFTGVEFRKYQIPEVPTLYGFEGKWVDENGEEADFTGINVDCKFYAYYELCKYLVTFYDAEGNVIPDSDTFTNNQMVSHGQSAVAPEIEIEGYNLSWDTDFAHVTAPLEVRLVKKLKLYNVTFVDWDGTLLKEESVFYGYNATEPVHPTKAADVQYTYTFAGWDKDGDGVVEEAPYVVSGDTEFKAVYTETLNKYRIIFVDEAGNEIQNRLFEYGRVPVIPEAPAKAADVQYTYTFAGWDKDGDGNPDEVAPVDGSATYKAVYSKTVNEYLVKFVDFDDTLISEQNVPYGSSAIAPENPTRIGYTFTSWDKVYNNITGELTVKATYTINQYTYKFVDEDGITVLKEETVDYQAPITAPSDPTKASTVANYYTFAGWDTLFDLMPANDVVITATYDEHIRKYVVTYKNGDTVVASYEEDYGTTATLPTEPTKEGYTFVGWLVNGATTPVDSFTITGEMEAIAKFAINTYTVYARIPFNLGNGNISYIEKEIISGEYNQSGLDIEEAIRSISWEREGYDLVCWKLEDGTEISLSELNNFTVPAQDTYLYPQYAIKKFNVKFYNDDTLISEQVVEWGNSAIAPENPVKEQTAEYTYTFLTWDNDYTSVKSNLTINAVYLSVKRQYTVTFLDDLGEVIGTSTVDYGTAAEEPANMKTTYVGLSWTWDADFSNVTENITVNATFVRKVYHITVYIGDMYYTYTRYYGESFSPLEEIQLSGNIELTGNLIVKSSSGELSQTYYEGTYTVEDVDYVSFDAEYIIR